MTGPRWTRAHIASSSVEQYYEAVVQNPRSFVVPLVWLIDGRRL